MSWLQRTENGTSWLKVILWWEIRRILFNIFFIAFAVILALIQDLFIKGGGGGSPIIILMIWALCLILANLFYTMGWVVDLIIQNRNSELLKKLQPKLFLFILFSTITIQLLYEIIVLAYALTQGYMQFR